MTDTKENPNTQRPHLPVLQLTPEQATALTREAATNARADAIGILADRLRLAGYQDGQRRKEQELQPALNRSRAKAAELAAELAKAQELAGDAALRIARAEAREIQIVRALRFRVEQLESQRNRARYVVHRILDAEPKIGLADLASAMAHTLRLGKISADDLDGLALTDSDRIRSMRWLADATGPGADPAPIDGWITEEHQEAFAATWATFERILDDADGEDLDCVVDALGLECTRGDGEDDDSFRRRARDEAAGEFNEMAPEEE